MAMINPPTISSSILVLLIASLNLCHCLRYSPLLEQCSPSGYLHGKTENCNRENDSYCCHSGEMYLQYHCSPSVTDSTHAIMTINSFARGGDGGGPSECDGSYHGDQEMVVALSPGWYDHGSRCLQKIKIHARNGNSVLAKVVDECDSVHGCDRDHDFHLLGRLPGREYASETRTTIQPISSTAISRQPIDREKNRT